MGTVRAELPPLMYRATIRLVAAGESGALHVSGGMTPYDLEVVREHVRAMCRRGRRLLRVEVTLPPQGDAAVLRELGELARRGVEVICSTGEP